MVSKMRAKESRKNAKQGVQKKTEINVSFWVYNQLLIFFCLIGLGLSLYAYTVELAVEENKGYKPYCDIGPHMSCTKAFSSPYGRGFGLFGKESPLHKPNSFYGIVFYSMVATLSLVNSPVAVNTSLVLIMLSDFASLYFAYILYFVLNDMCVVCIATYVVNVINLILITKKHKKMRLLANEAVEQGRAAELKAKSK